MPTHSPSAMNSPLSETSIDPNLVRRRLILAMGLVVVFQFVGFVLAYVYSGYWSRATFFDAFLFRPSDSTLLAEGKPSSAVLGAHHFGDFLWPLSTTRELGRGGYFGFSQLFFFLVRDLSPSVGLTIAVIMSMVCVVFALHNVGRDLSWLERLVALLFLFLTTQPVILAIDRGQIHLLLASLLLLGFSLQGTASSAEKRLVGSILVGVAVSMKLAPIFFLLFFCRSRYRDRLKWAIAGFVVTTLLPIALIRSGIGSLLSPLGLQRQDLSDPTDTLYFQTSYYEYTRAFNHSFRAFFDVLGANEYARGVNFSAHYSVVAVLLIFATAWLITSQRLSDCQALVVCAILTTRLIPISAGYTLIVFLVPVFWSLLEPPVRASSKNWPCVAFSAISMMPVQIALGFDVFDATTYTYSAVIGPGLSLAFLVWMLVRATKPRAAQDGILTRPFRIALEKKMDQIVRRYSL